MLESVGPLGYVIRKLNQVRQSGDTSQSRLEVIEIIEALILALVAVATAWSGYQAAMGGKPGRGLRQGKSTSGYCRRASHPGRPGTNLRQRHLQQLAHREAGW